MTHRFASLGKILLGLLGGLCLTAAAWAQTVTLTSPTNNQSFTAPASITLQATTSGSGIRKVEFYQGSTLIGSDSSSPYRITWSNVAAGSYSLTAKAKNKSGSVLATSTAVAIVVNGTVTISLTSPTNNQLFAAPATVTAVATTTGSGVAAVDFYGDGTLLGTATTSPYSFTQGNIPAGSHVVTAQARNSAGTVLATSAPVTILVDAPPTVSLTSPAPNQVLTAPATLTLAATAADSDGSVSRVDFYQGTTLIGTTTTSPYTATWNGVAPGTYTLSARATDNLGLVTSSAPVSLTVTAAGPATGMYFIHPDHLNTPRVVTDTNNTVVWRWDNNEPFGNTPANADPNATGTPFAFNLRFPGQYFDGESYTHYNYFRDYDPQTGRYVQSDPIGLNGGQWSTYTYVGGNPLSLVDPDGLLACSYDISSHTLSCSNNAGQSFSTYVTASGLGQCRDNPQCVDKPFKGPLPPGAYSIRPPGWSQRRPRWLYLDPDAGNQMHKRGGFFIHPWGISNGCIILHIPDFNTISGWAKQDGGGTLDVRD